MSKSERYLDAIIRRRSFRFREGQLRIDSFPSPGETERFVLVQGTDAGEIRGTCRISRYPVGVAISLGDALPGQSMSLRQASPPMSWNPGIVAMPLPVPGYPDRPRMRSADILARDPDIPPIVPSPEARMPDHHPRRPGRRWNDF